MDPSLRRIVISLHGNRRVILYPEGGLEIETFVRGVGWCLGDMLHQSPQLDLAMILATANALVGHHAALESDETPTLES